MAARKRPIKAPPTERLIFWSVAILLLSQLAWWIGLQVAGSRQLLEASLAKLRAGRAEAWLFDAQSCFDLRVTPPGQHSDRPGTVVGRMPETRSLAERRRAVEARFPFVQVSEDPRAWDDPTLLADTTVYLTLRPEVFQAMERERQETVRRVVLQAVVFAIGVLLGLAYIYRKLNIEMDLKLRQRNFIAAVTHELKTPIASLRVWFETLFSRDLGSGQKARIQELMEGDLTRLTALVSNLLSVARAESGRLELFPGPVELAPFLQEVAEDMDRRLGAGSLGLRFDLSPGIWVEVDTKAMTTVVENLLSNAYKYSEEPRQTTVTLDADTQTAIIAVSDQGHGIRPRELSRLFQRFYRAGDEMTRTVPGTGLGLYLCKETVLAHGGEIRASSLGPGLGTTFTIRLPRIPAPEGAASQAPGLPIG